MRTEQVFRTPKLVYALLAMIFLFFVIIDASTTEYLVANHPSGINVEGNPFVKQVVSEYGWTYLILMKLVGFVFIALFALGYAKKQQHLTFVNIGLIMMLAIAVIVQVNNLNHII